MAVARRKKSDFAQPDPYYARGGPALLADVGPAPEEEIPSQAKQEEWGQILDHYEQRFQAMYNWRLGTWQTWQQIARYEAPWRNYIFITANTYDKGIRNDFNILDRTATLAGEMCAAGLAAGLTDPDSEWLELGPAIPGIELDAQGKMYYEDLTERLNYVYDHSNFYDAQTQHFSDLTFFGTAPLIDYPDAEEILHCFTPCAGEYLLSTGFDFSDEVFNREFRLTVSQMIEMFGPENCPQDVLEMWRDKGGGLEYENVIGHSIEPNFAMDNGGNGVGVVPGGFTWREGYWLRGKKGVKPLSMTGFNDQPFVVSRWDTQGNDPYGRGVGEKMLSDTIQLQLETRQKGESIQKVNTPPMGADVSLQNQPNSQKPNAITYFNTAQNGEKKFFPLLEIKPDIPAITADIALVQERIRKTAYNDVFATIANLRQETRGQVTATEIDGLKEEALAQLGPVIGRIHGTLRKRVRRHLSIMKSFDLLPRKPASLRNVPLKISLISMLTRARKASATAAIARTFQFAGSISGVYPEAKFALDPVEGVRQFNEGVGGTSKIERSPNAVKKMIQALEQQQKAAQALSATQAGAAAAGDLSKASLAPGNALSALVGGQQPQ